MNCIPAGVVMWQTIQTFTPACAV